MGNQEYLNNSGVTLKEGDAQIGKVGLVDEDGNPITQQNPLQVDGDSVHASDIWVEESEMNGFSGAITDLFDNLHSVITDGTTTNPKHILIHFNRTTVIQSISLGAYTGNFSNVKISILTSSHAEFFIVDESTDNTKYSSRTFELPIVGFNAFKIEFHTTDAVSLSNCFIPKVQAVSARIQGQDDDGLWNNVGTTHDGDLTISDNSSGLSIAQGKVTGTSFVSKFGQNENVGTGAFEEVWDGGGTYVYPADNTAPITHIYSTGADIQPIEVQGLDINGDLVVQSKTLTGTTVVVLDTPLWRVFRMKNTGSSTILTGSIVHASDSGKAVSYAQIQNGNNQTLMALYTIPAGKTGYLTAGSASIVGLNRAYSIDGHMYMREFGGVHQLKHTFGVSSDGSSYFQHKYDIPLPIQEKTDIKVSVISSANGGIVNATFDIVLVDN